MQTGFEICLSGFPRMWREGHECARRTTSEHEPPPPPCRQRETSTSKVLLKEKARRSLMVGFVSWDVRCHHFQPRVPGVWSQMVKRRWDVCTSSYLNISARSAVVTAHTHTHTLLCSCIYNTAPCLFTTRPAAFASLSVHKNRVGRSHVLNLVN